MRRGIKNNLSKTFILSKVSQDLIFSKYTGIPIEIINKCVTENSLICSPFRNDRHPTVGFAYNDKHKLKIRDFAGYGMWGDCFDVVAYVLSFTTGRQINVSVKADFYYVLKHIAYTFRNIIYNGEVVEENEVLLKETITRIKNSKAVIELVIREWNENDKKIWSKWGISLHWLNTHFVVPVDQMYINRFCQPEPKYNYRSNDPCYGYITGLDSKGIYNIECYFPLRDRTKGDVKFITNHNGLVGLLNLNKPKYDIIIITKSYKDNLALDSWLHSFPLRGRLSDTLIGVINVTSESYVLKPFEYEYLQSKLNDNGIIISFFDMDLTGVRGARRLRKDYGIIPILIPRIYDAKDFSELIEKYSKETINRFIEETEKLFDYE